MVKARTTMRGLQTVFNNLNREINKLEGRTEAGLHTAAQFIRKEAVKKAPIMLGNLRNSAFVTSSKGIDKIGGNFKEDKTGQIAAQHESVKVESAGRTKMSLQPAAEVGFSVVYATSVHENPRAGKTEGINPDGSKKYSPGGGKSIAYATKGEYKFLENALKENTKRVLQIIQSKARIK